MPRPATHPGEILADELTELKITPTELSRQLSVPPNRISQIIQGKRAITGDTALRLSHWFQTSAQFWLNLQSAYDLRATRSDARWLHFRRRLRGGGRAFDIGNAFSEMKSLSATHQLRFCSLDYGIARLA